MKTALKLFTLFVAITLLAACNKDKDDNNEPIEEPVNDTTQIIEQESEFPEICYGDSVWLDTSSWGTHVRLCCVPLEDNKFYCYAYYDEGYGVKCDELFQDGWRYEYYYSNDGSDSLRMIELGVVGNLIHLLNGAPHICFTKMYDPEGEAYNIRCGRIWTVVVNDDGSVSVGRFPPDMSLYPDFARLPGFVFTKTLLTR